MFLTKCTRARHVLLLLVLALCCLTNAEARRITRTAKAKIDKSHADESAKQEAAAAAEAAEPNSNDNDESDDDDDDDDEDEDDKQAQQALTTALKNALPESWASSSFASTVNTLWNWFGKGLSESFFGGDDNETKGTKAVSGRTFGKIRRLQMALIPIIFKFGILTAMVAFLVAIGMKSLFLLKVLIVMNAAAILGKFLTFKTGLGEIEHAAPSFNYNGWNPHVRESSWTPTGPAAPAHHSGHPTKEIHLHIHGGQAQLGQSASSSGYNYDTQGWQSRSDPYGGYAPTASAQVEGQSDVPNNTDPFSMLPTKYPAQHLAF